VFEGKPDGDAKLVGEGGKVEVVGESREGFATNLAAPPPPPPLPTTETAAAVFEGKPDGDAKVVGEGGVVEVVGESREVFARKQDGDAEEEHSDDDMPDLPNLSSLPSPYQHEEELANDIFSSLENYRDTYAKCNGLSLEKVLSFDEMAQIARRRPTDSSAYSEIDGASAFDPVFINVLCRIVKTSIEKFEVLTQAEEQNRLQVDEQATRMVVEQSRKEFEEAARLEAEKALVAEERVRNEADKEARKVTDEQARIVVGGHQRMEAEDDATFVGQEQAGLLAEDRVRKEAKEQARLGAAEEAHMDTEEQTRLEAEKQDRHVAEKRARKVAKEVAIHGSENGGVAAGASASDAVVEAVRSTIFLLHVAIGTNTNIAGGSKQFNNAIRPLLQSHSEDYHERSCVSVARFSRQTNLVRRRRSCVLFLHSWSDRTPWYRPRPCYIPEQHLKLKQQLQVGVALSALSLTPLLLRFFWGVPGGGRGVCGGVRSANQLKVTR
jgi:hypothetical protein